MLSFILKRGYGPWEKFITFMMFKILRNFRIIFLKDGVFDSSKNLDRLVNMSCVLTLLQREKIYVTQADTVAG